MKFHIAGAEFRIVLNGKLHQVKTIIFIEQGMGFLQRIVRGNNKPDLVDLRIFYDMICYDKMTYVNGVKASEIQPYVHGRKCSKKRRVKIFLLET